MANERILIVEDNITLEGEPLAMNVKKAGYVVVGIAETERSAVEMALRERPDVVLIDIELVDDAGKKDRLAGLRAAHKIRMATGAQIIFVTGTLAEPEVLSEAQKTPDYEFLIKPVSEKQLLASIKFAVGRAKPNQPVTSALVVKAKEAQGKFDVFLSHNSKDKAAVEKIAKRLLAVGIRPWLDKWNLAGGDTIETALEDAIKTIPCAALCFGPADMGEWHIMEIRAYLAAWAKRKARMIPIVLPGVEEAPELPLFVQQALWVDMRDWEKNRNDGFYRLVCGILGRAPGDSPARKFGVREVAEWQGLTVSRDAVAAPTFRRHRPSSSSELSPGLTMPVDQIHQRYGELINKKFSASLSGPEIRELERLEEALDQTEAPLYEPLKRVLRAERDNLKRQQNH